MRYVTSDVVLEAEMVAFSDATERIDGESYPRFMSHQAKSISRVLEDSESDREHRCRSETQGP